MIAEDDDDPSMLAVALRDSRLWILSTPAPL